MPEDQNEHHQDEDLTTSTMERWQWTGTLLAFAMILSLPAIIGLAAAGILSISIISQGWFALYSIVVLMAATWAFGKETLEAVQKARGK